jgi:hypothetical protein
MTLAVLYCQGLSALVFMPCIELHQERKHLAWQFLWNFIVAAQRLTYRNEHGESPLFSCKVTTRAGGLIEGDLSWAPSLFCAPPSN